jgi:hypothetical protein
VLRGPNVRSQHEDGRAFLSHPDPQRDRCRRLHAGGDVEDSANNNGQIPTVREVVPVRDRWDVRRMDVIDPSESGRLDIRARAADDGIQ